MLVVLSVLIDDQQDDILTLVVLRGGPRTSMATFVLWVIEVGRRGSVCVYHVNALTDHWCLLVTSHYA